MATTSSLPNTTTETQKFFNTSNGKQFTVDSNTYNQIYNFFRSRSTSDLSAQQLTQYLIIMTYNNKLNSLAIINQLATDTTNDIKSLVITFFNGTRDAYSKLGFSNASITNYWVDRNIIA
jgi:hypothetical protein